MVLRIVHSVDSNRVNAELGEVWDVSLACCGVRDRIRFNTSPTTW